MNKILSAGITNVGLVRENNEDNFYINGRYKKDAHERICAMKDDTQRKEHLYAICDGMGGEAFGEEASLIAVEALAKYTQQGFDKKITAYANETNQLICDKTKRLGSRIGTTLALLYIKGNNQAVSCNLGDSRIYLFRGNEFRQLSKDHTQAQRLVDLGILKQGEAVTHKDRNILTQHLGIFPEEFIIEPYIVVHNSIRHDDVFLLCSDGLTDMVNDDEILRILSSKAEAPSMSEMLVEKALENGGKDNVSVIVVQIT